jgi:heme/copper-type cytochrome/quinol oxidase subunit 2
MANKRLLWAKIALVLLTLGEMVSVYQVLFCAWMTAYQPASASEWRARFYVRLTTSVLIGLLWIALVVWLIRQRRKVRTLHSDGQSAASH